MYIVLRLPNGYLMSENITGIGGDDKSVVVSLADFYDYWEDLESTKPNVVRELDYVSIDKHNAYLQGDSTDRKIPVEILEMVPDMRRYLK